ncbi:MAG TPA: hypothetical protein VIT91_16425 [Chthoniobacterales bacterium]
MTLDTAKGLTKEILHFFDVLQNYTRQIESEVDENTLKAFQTAFLNTVNILDFDVLSKIYKEFPQLADEDPVFSQD